MVRSWPGDSSWDLVSVRPLSLHPRESLDARNIFQFQLQRLAIIWRPLHVLILSSYLAEIAPRSIRGLCVTIFSGSVYLGIMLGYFANWGTSIHVSNHISLQWIDPTVMHLCFAGIILVMTLFAPESPRYLCKQGQRDKAAINLSKLRQLPVDHPYVSSELTDINDQLGREREATEGSRWFGPLKELFVVRSNRYRILLTLGSQLLGRKRLRPISLYEHGLTYGRMERRKFDHYICATILRAPGYDRPN
jgi:hypothetical protein